MLNRSAGRGTHEGASDAVMTSHQGSNRRALESPVSMTGLGALLHGKDA